MSTFLPCVTALLLLIVLIGFFNEKVTKLTYEISLMIFSVVIGGIVVLLGAGVKSVPVLALLSDVRVFDLESFLMKGVLCFMLFAGSCHMKLGDFKRLARPVGILAGIATLFGAVFYALLFFAASSALGLHFSLPVCLMFGSIVAPTDPIAATSILKKFGLPKDTGFLIEGESLLNDGVGVALFVCFSGLVVQNSENGFFAVMAREVLGAVLIGAAVTSLFFLIFRRTEDNKRRIFVSLLTVALSYWLCECFSCSGAIASVVCGVLFSALISREEENGRKIELREFDDFWEILDNLLNSVLYVILGLSFIRILQMPMVLLLSLVAVAGNLLGRFGSVYLCTFLMGTLPDGYNRLRFSELFTWGALRGGLSIALAMSAQPMLSEEIYRIVLGCTYAIVFFTTVIQGLTMKKVYENV